jgi:hypothetical protein
MKNAVWTILVASSLGVGAFAQGPGQPSDQNRPGTQQLSAAQPGKATVSGCIQSAPPAAPAAGGAPAASEGSKFDLANAKAITPAPTGTAGSAVSAVRYRLEGDQKVIAPHLNHQVEVTGTVSPASGTGATAAPMLKVESLKMVATACPGSSR